MMSKNPNKDKGTRWEREAVSLLNEKFPGTWIRIPGSGAIGTQIGIPILKGDIKGKYTFIPKSFLGEAKVGYGGSKQVTVKKEWFDKIAEEAKESYSLPVVVFKFLNARAGVKYVIAMDFEIWDELLEEMETMYETLVNMYKDEGT